VNLDDILQTTFGVLALREGGCHLAPARIVEHR
jgi:hypothetical protein